MAHTPPRRTRPSLYAQDAPAVPAAFSVLDAATVQGQPKRRITREPRPTRRRHVWLIALLVLGGASLAYWAQGTAMTEGPYMPPTATTAAATATPKAAPAPIPAIEQARPAPALIEQLEAPATAAPAGDPLRALKADVVSPAERTTKPAKPAPQAKAPSLAAKAAPAARIASEAAQTAPRRENDGDVDLMEAVLSRMDKPGSGKSKAPH